jgi:hypothetical protein
MILGGAEKKMHFCHPKGIGARRKLKLKGKLPLSWCEKRFGKMHLA